MVSVYTLPKRSVTLISREELALEAVTLNMWLFSVVAKLAALFLLRRLAV